MQIEGTIYWCKLDKLRPNYNKQHKIMEDGEPKGWGDEWSVVFGNLSKETKLALKDAGLLGQVKNKMDDLEDFITFRLAGAKKDGELNTPIAVTDAQTGKPWDWSKTGNGLIGNKSTGVMKFNTWKSGNGKVSAFPVSMLVLSHEEYEGADSENSYEDPDDWSEYLAPQKADKPAKAKKPIDLDDDVPA